MNSRLTFPEVTDAQSAFGQYPEDWFKKTLLIGLTQEDEKWRELFSSLFFGGGSIDVNRTLPKDYLDKGLQLLKAVMGSFTPKHEHKEVVSALILKSLCDTTKEK